ncbi:MAG: PQQ-binding-like beta-propeller repeat protein [Candidatus Bathyarchaeia archaeon]
MNIIANNIKNKTKIAAIPLLLLLIGFAAITALPLVSAHTPAWNIPTYAYLVVSPDPIGVGQTAFIVMWIDKVPPSAGGVGGDRWTGFTVKVTKPDGSQQTLGPFISDATSAYATLYTPDQVGTYTFLFTFPGQTASLYHPETGVPGTPSFGLDAYIGDYYMPSSTSTTLTVQANPVQNPPTYPLPTSYWTRPIEGQNTAWGSIASNYLRGAANFDKVQPNGLAPNTPHIMWTKPLEDGGIVGDSANYFIPDVTYYTGLSYEGRFGNPIIINGRLYYDTPLGNNPTSGPYTCVDLRTGETLWTNNAISPTFGMIYLYESMNQHGAMNGYLIQTEGGVSFFGPPTPAKWIVYDARTGAWLFNMTNVQAGYGASFLGGYGSGANGPSGEALVFTLGNGWLAMWNSSAGATTPLVSIPGTGTDAYQYRPVGKNADMSKAYTWNVSIPALPAGSSIIRAIPDDLLLLSTPMASFISFGTPDPYTVTAISLKPASRGQILWQKAYPAPAGNLTRAFGTVDPKTRVFTMVDKETMQWSGYSLDNGNKLWGPVGDFRDFQYYGTVSHPPAPGFPAYGNLYVGGYGGEILCFDQLTGALKWKYNNTFSGDQTPWGLYPLFIGAIADGKIYAYTSEHSPNAPPYKGSKLRCIDAYTGEELWTLDSWVAIGSFGEEGIPVADGYMAYLNVYDNQIYCIGKGPSATTVTASPKVTSVGSSVMIEGFVTDVCAGAKKLVADGKFNIVPAMSDKSMGAWMEYLYMQKPMPTDAVGVQVKLTAIDPNGNIQNIGTVTSDTAGMFKKMWTPPVPGEYTIIATFEGSGSYFGSSAETSIGITEAPAASPTVAPTVAPTTAPTVAPTPSVSPSVVPEPESPAPSMDVYVVAAAVAVVLVVVAVAAVFLRKRK